jgi:hypothetical protein
MPKRACLICFANHCFPEVFETRNQKKLMASAPRFVTVRHDFAIETAGRRKL